MSYKYPKSLVENVIPDPAEKSENRFSLTIKLTNAGKETIVVILKNPSKADAEESDYTVNMVINYICCKHRKEDALNNIGSIVIVNLLPCYKTNSKELYLCKPEPETMISNMKVINEFTSKHKKVIVAWGNHPRFPKGEFDCIIKEVLDILKKNGNDIYQVGFPSVLKNPKHGQVWKYCDALQSYPLSC